MIDIGKLTKTMDQASKDCISEGKRNKFPVFLQVQDPEERTGKLLSKKLELLEQPDIEGEEEEQPTGTEEELPDPIEFDEEDSSKMISTKLYGELNFRTAETLLLNGGKSTLTTKSRLSRFKGDTFGVSSDIRIYNQAECQCPSRTKIGDTLTLPTVSQKKSQARVKGEVRYLSYKGSPLKFYCSEHSLVCGSPYVWLLVGKKYLRCSLNNQ